VATTATGTGVAALGILAVCCGPAGQPAPKHHLVEKGSFQALYNGIDGHLERVAYDSDGDHRAEVVTFFAPNGRPIRAEIDNDNDGVVDRWEYYAPDGKIAKVATAVKTPGRPDLWSYPDGFGGVSRREYDDDGDGKPERAETYLDGTVVSEEFDTDGDGRWDRRLVRGPDGSVARVDLDPEENGGWRELASVGR
jgi:hypothetical protein